VAAQIKLINGSTRVIRIGDPVKLHATKKNSFDYANLGDIMIGSASQQVSPGSWCFINLLGSLQWDDIIGRGSKVTVSPTQPTAPALNEIWIDSST
jgi:hypothetical protein